MCRSDGVSINISLPSIMAYVFGYLSLNTGGKVPATCSTDGIQLISLR